MYETRRLSRYLRSMPVFVSYDGKKARGNPCEWAVMGENASFTHNSRKALFWDPSRYKRRGH